MATITFRLKLEVYNDDVRNDFAAEYIVLDSYTSIPNLIEAVEYLLTSNKDLFTSFAIKQLIKKELEETISA